MERVGGSFKEDAADQKGGCPEQKAKSGIAAVASYPPQFSVRPRRRQMRVCGRPPPQSYRLLKDLNRVLSHPRLSSWESAGPVPIGSTPSWFSRKGDNEGVHTTRWLGLAGPELAD